MMTRNTVQNIHHIEYNSFCGFVSKVTGWEGFQRRDVPKTPLTHLSADLFDKADPCLPGCLINEDIATQVGQKRLLFYAPEPGKPTYKTCLVRKCYQNVVNSLRELTCPPILLTSGQDSDSNEYERKVIISGPSGSGLSTFVYFLMASMIDGSWLDDSGGLVIPTSAHPKEEHREDISSSIDLPIQGFWKVTRKSIHWIPIDENSQPCKIWQSDKHKGSRQSEPSLKTFWTVYEGPLDLKNVTLPTYRSIMVTPLEQIESNLYGDSTPKRLLILPRWTTTDILLALLWSVPKAERNNATIINRILQYGPILWTIFSHETDEIDSPISEYSDEHFIKPWTEHTPFTVWWDERGVFEKVFRHENDNLPPPIGIQFKSKIIAQNLLSQSEFRESLHNAALNELIPNFIEIDSTAKSQSGIRVKKIKSNKDIVDDKPINTDPENIIPTDNIPTLCHSEDPKVNTNAGESDEALHEVKESEIESVQFKTKNTITEDRQTSNETDANQTDAHQCEANQSDANQSDANQSNPLPDEEEEVVIPNVQDEVMIKSTSCEIANSAPCINSIAEETDCTNEQEQLQPSSAITVDSLPVIELEYENDGTKIDTSLEHSLDIAISMATTGTEAETSSLQNEDCMLTKDQIDPSLSLISSPTRDSVMTNVYHHGHNQELIEPSTAIQSFPTTAMNRNSTTVVQRKSLDPKVLSDCDLMNDSEDLILPPVETVISSPCRVEISGGESSGEGLTPQFHYLEREEAASRASVGLTYGVGGLLSPSAQCTATTQQATRIQPTSLIESRSNPDARLLQQDISILEAQKEKAAREVRVCEAALITMKRKLTELVTEHLVGDGSKRCRISLNGS